VGREANQTRTLVLFRDPADGVEGTRTNHDGIIDGLIADSGGFVV